MNIFEWWSKRKKKAVFCNLSPELVEFIRLYYQWALSNQNSSGRLEESRGFPLTSFDSDFGLCQALRTYSTRKWERYKRYKDLSDEFLELRTRYRNKGFCKQASFPFGGKEVFDEERNLHLAHKNIKRLAFCRDVLKHNPQ